MQIFNCKQSPVEVHGLPFFYENGKFSRLPEKVEKAAPCAGSMSPCSVGARICFRTDSPTLYLKMEVEPLSFTSGMSMVAGQSLHALFGDRSNPFYAGAWTPAQGATVVEGVTPFRKKEGQEEVTVYLPRNAVVKNVWIGIEDGAKLMPPTPYKYPPILYYGSSITAGGSCCVPFNAYNAVISHHLNVDYYNFGFSGSCTGELPVAECIGDIPVSIFVYDYDHNAPNADFLQKTHEPFFLAFRKKQPLTPVVMLSKPDVFGANDEDGKRRDIIYQTYLNAKNRGDSNVYFIDGCKLFGDTDRFACTADSLHPNDFGARKMAEVIEPVIKTILEKIYG